MTSTVSSKASVALQILLASIGPQMLATIAIAQPIQVKPTEQAGFQMCFYYENLPGNPPAVNQLYVLQLGYQTGGYHSHDDGLRPRGTLQPTSFTTDGSGCSPFLYYTATIVSGRQSILITGGGTSNTQEIWVYEAADGGPCCVQLYAGADYYFQGTQPEHPSWYGYNGTLHVVNVMPTIASQFRQQTGRQLCINDMSLNWGGVFDLGPRYRGTWWNGPHGEHRKGLNVDLPFSCLDPYRQTAYNIAVANGGGDGPGGVLVHPDHYHLRFAY